jgi:hypothetical protein
MSLPRNKGENGRLKKGIRGRVEARGDNQKAAALL